MRRRGEEGSGRELVGSLLWVTRRMSRKRGGGRRACLHEARHPTVAVHRPGVCSAAPGDTAGPARSSHAHIVDSESVGELRRERARCRSRTQLGRLGSIRLKGMNAGAGSKRAEQPERV